MLLNIPSVGLGPALGGLGGALISVVVVLKSSKSTSGAARGGGGGGGGGGPDGILGAAIRLFCALNLAASEGALRVGVMTFWAVLPEAVDAWGGGASAYSCMTLGS